MSITTKITDLLFRRQKTLEIITIFLFFSLVAFRFNARSVDLFWSNSPAIAILLAIAIALLAIIWIRIEKRKTQLLIDRIQIKNIDKEAEIKSKLLELSLRQREVLDLILKGKSNKEITESLHIELSTLKTHINQIYKILGIKSRKETGKYGNEKQ